MLKTITKLFLQLRFLQCLQKKGGNKGGGGGAKPGAPAGGNKGGADKGGKKGSYLHHITKKI